MPSFVSRLTVLRIGFPVRCYDDGGKPAAVGVPSIDAAFTVHSLAGHERSSPSVESRRRCVHGCVHSTSEDAKRAGHTPSDLRFCVVEAMGLEPTNLLTASENLEVRGSSFQVTTGALPGLLIQGSSEQSGEICPRCLHRCLHFRTIKRSIRSPPRTGIAER